MEDNAGLDEAISKRFQVLKGKRYGVAEQAVEEFVRFLNVSLSTSVPWTVEFLELLLLPYAGGEDGGYALPTTWQSKPKIGRWWDWLEDGAQRIANDDADGIHEPMAQAEFEKRFA